MTYILYVYCMLLFIVLICYSSLLFVVLVCLVAASKRIIVLVFLENDDKVVECLKWCLFERLLQSGLGLLLQSGLGLLLGAAPAQHSPRNVLVRSAESLFKCSPQSSANPSL